MKRYDIYSDGYNCCVPEESEAGEWVKFDDLFDLPAIEAEVREWADRNFGDVPTWQPLLGAVEELGELAHSHLKEAQGIRGTTEKHVADAQDAIGDIVVYLIDYCGRRGWSLSDLLSATWSEVRQRDWKANPADGGPAPTPYQEQKAMDRFGHPF